MLYDHIWDFICDKEAKTINSNVTLIQVTFSRLLLRLLLKDTVFFEAKDV